MYGEGGVNDMTGIPLSTSPNLLLCLILASAY